MLKDITPDSGIESMANQWNPISDLLYTGLINSCLVMTYFTSSNIYIGLRARKVIYLILLESIILRFAAYEIWRNY